MTEKGRHWVRVAIVAGILCGVCGFVFLFSLYPAPDDETRAEIVAGAFNDAVESRRVIHTGDRGYVLDGDLDFEAVRPRLRDFGVPVRSTKQVTRREIKGENGGQPSSGPALWAGSGVEWLDNETQRRLVHVHVRIVELTRFHAAVRVEHTAGGTEYEFNRRWGRWVLYKRTPFLYLP